MVSGQVVVVAHIFVLQICVLGAHNALFWNILLIWDDGIIIEITD